MSKTDTWMPLYIGDYLADTMKLNGPQHGAYLLLIMDYWRNGPLADDDDELAAIARTQIQDWKKSVGPKVKAFFNIKDGLLHHKRIDKEREKTLEVSSKRRDAANARHTRNKTNADEVQTGCNGDANAPANAEQLDTHAGARQSQSQKERTEATLPAQSAHGQDPADIRTELWRDGLAIFRRMTGKADGQGRAFLGKMLRADLLADDCSAALTILREAESRRVLNAEAWIVAACKARQPQQSSMVVY